jgi:hypothetical protein
MIPCEHCGVTTGDHKISCPLYKIQATGTDLIKAGLVEVERIPDVPDEALRWTQIINGIPSTIKVTRLEDRKPGESWALLLYGPIGSGKTYFCGTGGDRTLYINIGEGITTLESPAFQHRYGQFSKKMITIDITRDPNANANEVFYAVLQTIEYFVNKASDLFDLVVVDDATFLRRAALDLGQELNAGQSDTARSKQRKEALKDGKFIIPEPGDFNREMNLIEWFLAETIPQLKAEKKHFIMTAHERNIYKAATKNEGGGFGEQTLVRTLPGFTGKTFPDQVPAYFDDVFRSECVSGNAYRILTAGDDMTRGKARHGGIFPFVVVDPNFRVMLNMIRKNQLHPDYGKR